MYAMSQHPYAYAVAPAPPPPPPRQYSGTSSAFSSSANPDEDWTQISDLAERRRIQNRIAQRNYRKKLKRRLEDLERRAGTSDGTSSPSASGTEKPSQPSKSTKKSSSQAAAAAKTQKATPAVPAAPPKPLLQPQFTPPMCPEDEYLFPPSTYGERSRSQTPPMFAYPTYPPPPEEMLLAPYGAQPQPAYRQITTESYSDYLAAATTGSMSLPSVTHFSDMFGGYVPGMELGGASPYDNSNPHTPPLSHSFDHSANCSDAGYEYPTTPLSMPDSPGMVPQQL